MPVPGDERRDPPEGEPPPELAVRRSDRAVDRQCGFEDTIVAAPVRRDDRIPLRERSGGHRARGQGLRKTLELGEHRGRDEDRGARKESIDLLLERESCPDDEEEHVRVHHNPGATGGRRPTAAGARCRGFPGRYSTPPFRPRNR